MSKKKDTEFEAISCRTIVVRSEKAFFFNYGSHYCPCCSVLRRTVFEVVTSKSAYKQTPAARGYTGTKHACSQRII